MHQTSNGKVVQFSVDAYKIADECGFKKEEIELFFRWGLNQKAKTEPTIEREMAY